MFLNKEPSGSHTTDPHYPLNHAKFFDTIDDATTISKLKTNHDSDFTESTMNNLPRWLMYEEHHYCKLLFDLPALLIVFFATLKTRIITEDSDQSDIEMTSGDTFVL